MACPYFIPERKLEPGSWTHLPRLPLGGAYAGRCLAAAAPHTPSESHQRELCNCGYARGLCDRFPDSGGADAVRFSVVEDRETGLRLVWVLEKEHAPLSHGVLEFSIVRDAFENSPGEFLLSQARAFVENYLPLRASSTAQGA